jgi:hypothetical protein
MNGHLPDGIEFMREGMLVTVGLGKNHGRDYVDVHLENGIPIVLKDIHFQRRLMILVALINC